MADGMCGEHCLLLNLNKYFWRLIKLVILSWDHSSDGGLSDVKRMRRGVISGTDPRSWLRGPQGNSYSRKFTDWDWSPMIRKRKLYKFEPSHHTHIWKDMTLIISGSSMLKTSSGGRVKADWFTWPLLLLDLGTECMVTILLSTSCMQDHLEKMGEMVEWDPWAWWGRWAPQEKIAVTLSIWFL